MNPIDSVLSDRLDKLAHQRTIIDKPWGYEEIFALVPGKFCGKILHLRSGHALSLHYHRVKEEVIAVQAGHARVEIGERLDALSILELGPGDGVRVPPLMLHRLTGLTAVVMLEASTSELDDVVRVSDRYGRDNVPEAQR